MPKKIQPAPPPVNANLGARKTLRPLRHRPGPAAPADVQLPTAPNQPPTDMTAYSFCIYGEKGVGKSTLAAAFPDVVAHFMFEVGRRGLKTPMIPQTGEPPLTWERTKSYFDLLRDTREPGRIVIDTLDVAAKLCQASHAARKGVPSVMNLNDYGRTWDELKTDWENTFNALIWAGWRFTFVSHARIRPKIVRSIPREELKEAVEAGVVATEIQPTATGWAYDWMKIPVEIAAYYGWLGHNRVLYVRGNQRMYAATGVSDDHFRDPRSSEPYDAIPMGSSPADAFANLASAWDNALLGGIVNNTVEEYETPSE